MNPRSLAFACALATLAAADRGLAENLVPNRDFDDHVLGWSPPPPLSAKMAFAPLDEHGSAASGSLRLFDLSGAFVQVASSCFPIEGGKPVAYGASAYAPGAEVPQDVRVSLETYDDPTCGGPHSAWPNDVSATTGAVTWATSQGTVVPAASRKAARLVIFLNAVPTPAPEVYLDNAFAWQGITCVPTSTVACLNQNRFRVAIDWEIPDGTRGRARLRAFSEASDSAYATFFDVSNVEVVLKVLDGRGVNGHFWVFVTGLTNVATVVRVRDTHASESWKSESELGTPFAPVLDTEAFESPLH